MRTNANGFNRMFGLCGAVGLAMVGAFYGCSSSTSGGGGGSGSSSGSSGNDASTSGSTSGSSSGSSGSGSGSGSSSGSTSDAGDGGRAAVLQKVTVTKLFADTADAGAANTDPTLLNAWGLVFNPTGVAWISKNHSDVLGVFPPGASAPAFDVKVPPPGDAGAGPSGQAFNAEAKSADGGVGAFKGDLFIAATESGTIAGWQPSDGTTTATASAVTEVNSSASGAVYKGLAILPTTPPVIAAADFHNNKVNLFDSSYAPITVASGKWADPSVPTGFAPFNIVAAGSTVYVLYAKQDAQAMDDAKGPGNGAISAFQTDGTLVKSVVKTGGALNSPWGLTPVPAGGWGSLPAGALVVGNFGDGTVVALDPSSGAVIGHLVTTASSPLIIDGLWGLAWGMATDAGETASQLYFTAGPNGENNGLFGYLTAQ